ncbi:hypothetical protein Sjap_020331 [Stephania japonica]|uniref:Uncharacterized protein n=1 Tax=Stephania japonica TaxID=461633 RepID=A0AAP0HYX0_9MAGN
MGSPPLHAIALPHLPPAQIAPEGFQRLARRSVPSGQLPWKWQWGRSGGGTTPPSLRLGGGGAPQWGPTCRPRDDRHAATTTSGGATAAPPPSLGHFPHSNSIFPNKINKQKRRGDERRV